MLPKIITESNIKETVLSEKSSPIAVFLSGESFFVAGQHLHKALCEQNLSLRFDMPVYYLFCHAIELLLKAFLRTRGYSEAKLRGHDFGHDIKAIWDEAMRQGLAMHPIKNATIESVIELLGPFAKSFEFRYVKVGLVTLPTLDEVVRNIGYLLDAVKPHCVATVDGPIPDRGFTPNIRHS